MVFKINKKTAFNAITSLVLLVALLISSIFCLLQTSETFVNIVTLGDIDIKLVEDGWERITDTSNSDYGSYIRSDGMSSNTALDEAVEKAPYIINTGVNDVKAFIIVKIPTLTEEEFYNTSVYLDTYNNKYDVSVSALGIQNGSFKDSEGNSINSAEDIWNSYMGERNEFFDEAKTYEERIELVDINGLDIGDEGTWSEAAIFKGKKHNYYVYGYNEVLRGLKYYEKELKTLNPDTDQDRINEINTLIESGEYDQTTQLFQSFQLGDGFGSGSNITTKPFSLGGALFYVDTEPKTYTNKNGETITINPGEDEDGHPYRYTFYDKNGEIVDYEEVIDVNVNKVANHRIVGYIMDIPEYYDTALANGDITQEEYNAVPRKPVWDKYYVVAAQDNANKTDYTLYYGNTSLTEPIGNATWRKFAESKTPMSPAYYPLDIHVKNFLIDNNLVDRYYNVDGNTWTLKTDGDTAYNSNKLIGMGKYNAKFIYEIYGRSNTNLFTSNLAYYLLDMFNNDTKAKRNKTEWYDWYIPSANELNVLKNVYKSPTAKFSVADTWSSSEAKYTGYSPANNINNMTTMYKDGNTSFIDGANRSITYKVLFVRSF